MGTSESQAEQLEKSNKIDMEKWKILSKDGANEVVIGPNGVEGEISVIELNPISKIENELAIYNFRKTTDSPIVKVLGAEKIDSNAGFCGVKKTMKVLTERITKLWVDLPQLPFNESLHSLSQALEGYKTLFRQTGAFSITPGMIGINYEGKLKVWLNEEFAHNHPSLEKGILYTTANNSNLEGSTTEGEMIAEIIKIIEAKNEQGTFPIDFLNHWNSPRPTTFNDALNLVDDYSYKYNFQAPVRIQSGNGSIYDNGSISRSNKYQQEGTSSEKGRESEFGHFSGSKLDSPFKTIVIQNGKQQFHPSFGKDKTGISTESIGYQTGTFQQPINDRYNLSRNPNINAAESVYESKREFSPYKKSNDNSQSFINQWTPPVNNQATNSGGKPKVVFGFGQQSNTPPQPMSFAAGSGQKSNIPPQNISFGYGTSQNSTIQPIEPVRILPMSAHRDLEEKKDQIDNKGIETSQVTKQF